MKGELLKGWLLLDILDFEDNFASCEYCRHRIRWGFLVEHAGAYKVVGSECVRSHLDDSDPEVAMRFLRDTWRQRRRYFYKRIAGLTWVVGPKKDEDAGWYLAATQSVSRFPWLFLSGEFETSETAKRYLAKRLFKTSWLGTKLREVMSLQDGGIERVEVESVENHKYL